VCNIDLRVICLQEKEYLKNAVAKIEAQRPHVLLVEKSVPLYAQQLLAKEISLVLNVKRSLLERISHCTGAQIASSIENISSTRLGQCQTFWIERVIEFPSPKMSNKKTPKTLMFFDGCPRRLGCTVMHTTIYSVLMITFCIHYYHQLEGSKSNTV
jgi:1-phosphatidylinositol-3-phosphate 5-kinase